MTCCSVLTFSHKSWILRITKVWKHRYCFLREHLSIYFCTPKNMNPRSCCLFEKHLDVSLERKRPATFWIPYMTSPNNLLDVLNVSVTLPSSLLVLSCLISSQSPYETVILSPFYKWRNYGLKRFWNAAHRECSGITEELIFLIITINCFPTQNIWFKMIVKRQLYYNQQNILHLSLSATFVHNLV